MFSVLCDGGKKMNRFLRLLTIRVFEVISLLGVILVDDYWKEILYLILFVLFFYLDCDGYDRKCSGHPDYIPNRFWGVK